MISLGLWVLALGVSAAQLDSTYQQTEGWCSPNIAHTGANVVIDMNCQGVDPKALEALNKDMKFTREQLRVMQELLQQAKTTPDPQIGQQAEALVREGKLQEANAILGKELGLTKGQLQRTIQQLEKKTREANDFARRYDELLQQASATPDTQVGQRAETLVRQGKLKEANKLLNPPAISNPSAISNPPAISMAQYHAIQPGMSYQEVVNILGRPGEEIGSGGNSMVRVVNYLWRNADGSLMMISFANDRVHTKTAPRSR